MFKWKCARSPQSRPANAFAPKLRFLLKLAHAGLGIALASAPLARGVDQAGSMTGGEVHPTGWISIFTRPPLKLPRYQQLDAPLLGNGDIGVAISGEPENQEFWLSKNDLWELRNVWCRSGPRPFGHLDIQIPELRGATYHAEQNLTTATTRSSFVGPRSTITMQSWVAATENLLVIELTCAGAPSDGEVNLWVPASPRSTPQVDHRPPAGTAQDWVGMASAPSFDDGAGVFWSVRAFREQVEIPAEVACAVRVMGTNDRHFRVGPGHPVYIVAALQSLRQNSRYLTRARDQVAGIDRERLGKLYQQHLSWWRDFWGKSAVELGDRELEWRYHVSNYILASCSRDPDYPPGIAGTWVTTDQPMWTGAYTMNYNHEACFYGLYSSNHLEQADPEDGPVLDFRARGEYYARAVFNCRGVLYPVKFGPEGIETTGDPVHPDYVISPKDPPWLREKGGLFLGQRSNAGYAAFNIAQRWYTTYDLDYAKKVYLFIRDVALFWEDYLKFEPTPPALAKATAELPVGLRQPPDGRYVIYKDGIHEGGQETNPIVSLALVRNILPLALDLGRALQITESEQGRWEHILAHLSAYSTQEIDGVTVFRLSEKGQDWGKGNSLGIQHIYPAGVIGLGSDPRLLEISRNTIAKMHRWIDVNGSTAFFPAAVRVGYDPNIILDRLHELSFLPNGIVSNIMHMLENCSIVPNTVDEMLLQSHQGVVRLFPDWPRGKNASFRTLRAYGAFLVSATVRDGLISNVGIFSEKGRPCVVQNPWPGRSVKVLDRSGRARTLSGSQLAFATEAGTQIQLIPVDG